MKYYKLNLLNEKVRQEKERLNNNLRDEYKIIFKLMDVLFIFFFVFNIGAVIITNMMVVKEVPPDKTLELREVNPIQAQMNGYKTHPEYKSLIIALLKQAAIYFIFSLGYFLMRYKLYTRFQLTMMLGIMFYYFSLSALDFFNDFGFVIGGWIYG